VNFELDGAHGLATATIGTKTFLFATAITDNGVSSFEVAANGTLTNRDNVDDSDDADLLLDGANAAATAKVGDKTFLFTVASNSDDGISVFEVSATGTLTNVDNVADDATLNLDGAFGINTVNIKGITYVFATGFGDDGFSAFVVAADGTLINVDNVKEADNPTDFELVDAHGLTVAKIGKDFFLYVTGRQDDGLSAFKIKPEGLTIIGSGAGELIDNTSSAPGQPLASGFGDKIFGLGGNDALKGLGGNDLLDGGAGQDFLFGGKGADRFVFALATDTAVGATRDVIVDFRHLQHDRINLTAIDANINQGGDQAFHFIGHHQFSGKAGELRFANHIVRGDTDGDGIADFEIAVLKVAELVKADFIL
jgi:Ca2+-binding RTX toxin-like protein